MTTTVDKAVLISINPEWCQKIFNGEKTIEIRKNKPKIQTPFKVYVYCTKAESVIGTYNYLDGHSEIIDCETHDFYYNSDVLFRCNGKVIGEFTVNGIEKFTTDGYRTNPLQTKIICKYACVDFGDVAKYEYSSKLHYLFAWYISNVKLYDKPKELSEFGRKCNLDCPTVRCPYWKYQQVNADERDYDCSCNNIRPLTNPPQSWCYVEEK